MTEEKEKMQSIFDELKSFIRQKEVELGIITIDDSETLSEVELCDVFRVSRNTLYRARRSGDLPFKYLRNGTISYDYSSVLLAINTGRFRVHKLSKWEAQERLNDYIHIRNIGNEI